MSAQLINNEATNNNELNVNNKTVNNIPAPTGGNNNQTPSGVNNNQAPASSGPAVYSGSNMTSEAAGLFLTAALMQDLNVENGQILEQGTQFQSLQSKYQQETTIEKYNKQALGSWLEMGSSLTSAAITGVTLGVDNLGPAGDLKNNLTTEQNQLDNLENMQKQAQEGLLKPKNFEMTETDLQNSPAVDNRIKEMQAGQFGTTSISKGELNSLESQEYTTYLNTRTDANGNAIQLEDNSANLKSYLDEQSFEAMTTSENQAVKGKIDEQVANKYKEVETTSQKWQATRGNNKMFSEIGTQVVRAGFDAGKAIATEQTGKQEALLTCEQFNQQIAQTVQQNEMEQIKNNRSTMDGEFAALVQGASKG